MRFWTASGNSVSRRYKEQRSRRPSSSRMRIWSQVWSWFPVSHAAKSQVPKMSAKQQECDRAGNAQGAKNLSAINPAAPATMLALPILAQQKTEPQPDRYLRIPAVGGVVFVGIPDVEIGSRPARAMSR
jgi:hypothetical protein